MDIKGVDDEAELFRLLGMLGSALYALHAVYERRDIWGTAAARTDEQ